MEVARPGLRCTEADRKVRANHRRSDLRLLDDVFDEGRASRHHTGQQMGLNRTDSEHGAGQIVIWVESLTTQGQRPAIILCLSGGPREDIRIDEGTAAPPGGLQ